MGFASRRASVSDAGKQVQVMQAGRDSLSMVFWAFRQVGTEMCEALDCADVQGARMRWGSGGELDISRTVGVDWVQSVLGAVESQCHAPTAARRHKLRDVGDGAETASGRILNGAWAMGGSMLWIKSPFHCPTDIEISQAFKDGDRDGNGGIYHTLYSEAVEERTIDESVDRASNRLGRVWLLRLMREFAKTLEFENWIEAKSLQI